MVGRSIDNQKFLDSIDRSRMASVLESTPKHYLDALKLAEKVEDKTLIERKILKVAFLGMGGSSIGGSLLRDWSYEVTSLPMEICRDSIIPMHLDKNTLVFAISYSGNTKETLDAFMKALKKGCLIVGVSSGGLLEEYCEKNDVLHVKIPAGFQPRLALPYLFTIPAIILEKIGIIKGISKEILDATKTLEKVKDEIKASIPTSKNKAKNLALKIMDTMPVIYGFREYASVAYRIKTQLNENSKMFCKFDILPELNHNEVVGWENIKPSLAKLLSVILLRSPNEPLEIKVRFEVLKEILSKKTDNIHEIYGKGETKLAKMLSTIYFGDYLSYYLAILSKIDPTPVKTISFLKEELEKRFI